MEPHHPFALALSIDQQRHYAWKGEFAGESGCCCLVSADPRDHFHRDFGVTQGADLLVDGAVERRVSVMEPHHPFALALSIDQQRDQVFERGRAGTDPFARSRSQICDGRTDQGIRPDQHIGLVQTFSRAKGEQVWSTRACSDETDNVTQMRWPDGSGKGCFRPYSHQSPIMPSATKVQLINWAMRIPPSHAGGSDPMQRGSMRRPSIQTRPRLYPTRYTQLMAPDGSIPGVFSPRRKSRSRIPKSRRFQIDS